MRVALDFDAPLGEPYADDPPSGEGWQLWSSYLDAPLSPVFVDSEGLVQWMVHSPRSAPMGTTPLTLAQARALIDQGSCPTAVFTRDAVLPGSAGL